MSAENRKSTTLRLIMPEWQGGDYDLSVSSGELYPIGARLLAFLAPESGADTVEVPIEKYSPGHERRKVNGVLHQDIVIVQMKAAMQILEERTPDRVVTFGGDCLVSQAPFDYLNGRYGDKLGVLWMDAHPDISTPQMYDREHAMVLGNLLGGGDPAMADLVKHKIAPERVLLAGMDEFNSPAENETVKSLGLTVIKPQEITENSDVILNWIKDNKIEYLAIHLDLDSLDPARFFSQLTNDPFSREKFPTVTGKLDLWQITRLLLDISRNTDVAGLTFAEYMPWDALHLQKMMRKLPIMR